MRNRPGFRKRYRSFCKARKANKRKALREKGLYQNILNETQAGVVAHDMLTGRIFYGNSEIRRIYQVKGDFRDLGWDSRLYKERGKNHLKPDREALRRGAVSKTVEIHESGRIYKVKGKIIRWCGREIYIEYLYDITDSVTASSRIFTDEIRLTGEQNHNMPIPNMQKRCSRNESKEKILMDILMKSMSFDFDEIGTVDSVNGRVFLVASGRYALNERMPECSYEAELKNLMERAASKEEAERLGRELELAHIMEIVKKDGVFLYETALLSNNGKYRLKQLRFIYLYEKRGMLLFTIMDIEDVAAAEKKKQEELEIALQMAEEANAAKMNFLACMSHEIRTPMNVIIGLISMMKEEAGSREEALDCADKLEVSSRYLLALLNDLLDMSRLESGNVKLQHQEFETKSFWENVNAFASAQARTAEVKYIFRQGEELEKRYVGDATRLQQILVNLISNAMKFTPPGGTVRVSVHRTALENRRAKLVIEVSDNGIGMSKEFLPSVFRVFTQEHDGMTGAYGGSGLGLSIARSYANLMDGDITVASEEGKGTTFTTEVWLLLPDGQTAEKKVVKSNESTDGLLIGKRVLLAEDHPLNTVVVSRLLAKRGIEVITAVNGKEAVDQFKKSGLYWFDAVLMDVRMPVMNGLEAAREIRQLPREDAKTVPIIAMTANACDEDRKKTKQAGMNAHLAKPIEPQELYGMLETIF